MGRWMGNVRLTLAGVAVSGSLIAGTICVILLIGPVIAFDAWPARGVGAREGRALVVSDVPPAGRALLGTGGFAPVEAPVPRSSAAPPTRSAAATSSAEPRVPAGSRRRHRRATRRATRPASAVAASRPTSSAPSTGGGTKARASSNQPRAGSPTTESPSTSPAKSERGSTGGAPARSDTGRSPPAASNASAMKGKHKGNGNGNATSTSAAPETAPPASDKGSGEKIPPGQAKKAPPKSDRGH